MRSLTLRVRFHVFLSLAILLAVWLLRSPLVAQSSCSTPPNNANLNSNGKPSGWAEGTTVKVYLDSNQYNQAQIDSIKAAFTNWENSGTNGDVTYQFNVQAGPPSQPTGTFVVVKKETPTDSQGVPLPTAGGAAHWSSTEAGNVNHVTNGSIQINPNLPDENLTALAAHEVGHFTYLGECPSCPRGSSVMSKDSLTSESNTGPTGCDVDQANSTSDWPFPPPESGGGCTSDAQCPCTACDLSTGTCDMWLEGQGPCSPIIIAVGPGSNYKLTSSQAGVWFDLNADGVPDRIAWTRAGDDVAFLVLDRNGNGIIDNGTELFGNYSILPAGERVTNGFEALAYYDRAEYGGNGDGVVDIRDAVWSQLRLWIDWNHNGVSEPDVELYSLAEFDLREIPVTFNVINRRDAYGNVFRLQALCRLGNARRQAYDVFFSAQPQRRPQ